MTIPGERHLRRLLELHPDGDIRETVLELGIRLAAFGSETDAGRKAALAEGIRDLGAVLEHELREAGSGGEDHVNDGMFHSRR